MVNSNTEQRQPWLRRFLKPSLGSLSRFLWALVLMTLPVTSFRYMPFMGSGTYVRPLALYPLIILMPVLLLRLKRSEIARPWPGALTIFLAFLLAAMAATAIGATYSPLELHGVDFFDRALRAAVTLMIGAMFFVSAVWMNQDEKDVKFSVRWLLLGLCAHLIWGAVQFVGLNSGRRQLLLQIQNLFSVRGLVKNKRISGFAYEPSWLAGQIAALYLPWLMASILMNYRALAGIRLPFQKKELKANNDQKAESVNHKRFPGWVALAEPLLFLAALLGLLMTYSRSGLFIAALAGMVTIILAGRTALSACWDWICAGFDRQKWTDFRSTLRTAGSRVLLGVVLLAVLIGAAVFLFDKGYISAMFTSDTSDLVSYAQDVYLGPRLAYASAALKAFEDHPFTGVGLGASGFGIYENMPDWVLSGQPEIARQMSPAANLYPNPKNLYVRLLSETGLVGFVLFLAFYLALFAEALSLLKYGKNIKYFIHLPVKAGSKPAQDAGETQRVATWLAAAGIFSLTAIFLQGVSQDSFAMPEMWINVGILAGAANLLKPI